MYCRKCGKEIAEDFIYCKHCGTKQISQKITIEFTKPSLKVNEDSYRNLIFCIGRFLKKAYLCVRPLILRLIVWGIVALITWNGIYYGFQYLERYPTESVKSIQEFREHGVILQKISVNDL